MAVEEVSWPPRGAGAHEAGGITVGILPGDERTEANADVDVSIPTGLGDARNALVVRAADAVVAVAGGYGTLSEIGLALAAGVGVVGVGTWELARSGRPDAGVEPFDDATRAVARALELSLTRTGRGGGATRPRSTS